MNAKKNNNARIYFENFKECFEMVKYTINDRIIPIYDDSIGGYEQLKLGTTRRNKPTMMQDAIHVLVEGFDALQKSYLKYSSEITELNNNPWSSFAGRSEFTDSGPTEYIILNPDRKFEEFEGIKSTGSRNRSNG